MSFHFADKADFYPTPRPLARKMIRKFSSSRLSRGGRWLEPTAGRGDLIEAVNDHFDSDRYYQPNVDAIELDKDLAALLLGKEINVIHDDFLSYAGKTQYDAIIMNPPFSNGARFLCHAWDTMYDGEIVCLLNAETMRNPHTQHAKQACELAAQHGDVEYVSLAFKEADRTTDVEVAIVFLKKEGDVQHDYFSGMGDGDNYRPSEETKDSQLTVSGRPIESIVTSYNKAVEVGIESVIKKSESDYYAGLLEGKGTKKTTSTTDVKSKINELVDDLKSKAWSYVIHSTDFGSVTTSSVRSKLMNDMERLKRIEFTEKNIYQFLINLVDDQDSIMADCVEQVFDLFTKYHKDNRVHIEGWKSNDYFFVNRKVVLPDVTELGWSGVFQLSYRGSEQLMDIDRVMAMLDGKRKPEISIADAFTKANAALNGGALGQKMQSSYFEIRAYKKGTMHLRFRDKDLLDRLNLIAGRSKGWLPKADCDVPKEFWLMTE